MQLDFSESKIENPNLLLKYQSLIENLKSLHTVFIGFSGGVDSTFLCGAARFALGKKNAKAFIAVGPSLAANEFIEAKRLAQILDLELVEYAATEFSNPAYIANGPDRCFHCKSDLFQHLSEFAQNYSVTEKKLDSNFIKPTLLYGGNLDDTYDYRPGIKAAIEFGARAPLAETELSKKEIRELSHIFGLPTADKSAQPCLSSRIPYGTTVDPKKLSMIEAGELVLAEFGFREFRLRYFGDTAKIEVTREQMPILEQKFVQDEIKEKLFRIGFTKMEIDPKGFRSGSLNEGLSQLII